MYPFPPHNVILTHQKQRITYKETVTPDVVRNSFYEQYRHEIDGLWRNSNYAWVFEGLLITAYVFVLRSLIESSTNIFIYNMLSIIISFLGLCVSAIWIAFAKASKTWQDWYEDRIKAFEQDYDLFPYERIHIMGGASNKVRDLDSSLHTTNCGKFSPGKINIFISQSVWLLWAIVASFHILNSKCLIVTLASYLTFYLLFVDILKKRCKNDYMEKEDFTGDYILHLYNKLERLQEESLKISDRQSLYDFFINKYYVIEWDFYNAVKDGPYPIWGKNPYSDLLNDFRHYYMSGIDNGFRDVYSYLIRISTTIDDCKAFLRGLYA